MSLDHAARPEFILLEAFLTSTAIVALAEIGDKTQLLAIVLAARFRKPVPIILGILVATLANHALAAFAGAQARGLAGRFLVSVSRRPLLYRDGSVDADPRQARRGSAKACPLRRFPYHSGLLLPGRDRRQDTVATIALGARYHDVVAVTAGTTLGMMLANVPAVFLGDVLLKRVPIRVVHAVAALLFIALGGAMLAGLLLGGG